mmetsp:Transcript_17361/g.47302  ORF Transcript_17361/g.47302 Transcript_17361/m.47302 type:complete len:459 (+) Transcript_17361:130-1506(+)
MKPRLPRVHGAEVSLPGVGAPPLASPLPSRPTTSGGAPLGGDTGFGFLGWDIEGSDLDHVFQPGVLSSYIRPWTSTKPISVCTPWMVTPLAKTSRVTGTSASCASRLPKRPWKAQAPVKSRPPTTVRLELLSSFMAEDSGVGSFVEAPLLDRLGDDRTAEEEKERTLWGTDLRAYQLLDTKRRTAALRQRTIELMMRAEGMEGPGAERESVPVPAESSETSVLAGGSAEDVSPASRGVDGVGVGDEGGAAGSHPASARRTLQRLGSEAWIDGDEDEVPRMLLPSTRNSQGTLSTSVLDEVKVLEKNRRFHAGKARRGSEQSCSQKSTLAVVSVFENKSTGDVRLQANLITIGRTLHMKIPADEVEDVVQYCKTMEAERRASADTLSPTGRSRFLRTDSSERYACLVDALGTLKNEDGEISLTFPGWHSEEVVAIDTQVNVELANFVKASRKSLRDSDA